MKFLRGRNAIPRIIQIPAHTSYSISTPERMYKHNLHVLIVERVLNWDITLKNHNFRSFTHFKNSVWPLTGKLVGH